MYLALDRLQTGVFGPGLQCSVNCRLGSSGPSDPTRPPAEARDDQDTALETSSPPRAETLVRRVIASTR